MLSTEITTLQGAEGPEAALAGPEAGCDRLDPRARRQAAVLAFGRRSSARPRLSVLIQDAVALVAETLEADLTGVAEVAADGTTLVLKVAAPGAQGEEAGLRVRESSLSCSPLATEGSMAAYALEVAGPVVTPQLAADDRFVDSFLRGLGVQSAITVPLRLDDAPFGALGVYRKLPRPFTPDDVQFAETIACLLISSIARGKAEESLREQEQFASAVLSMVDALVMTLDPEGRVLSVNRACRRLTGFSLDEIRGRHFCNVFAVRQEVELFQTIFRRAVNSRTATQFESQLLTKDGSMRRVTWSLQVLCKREDVVQSLILTGADRSEACGPCQEAEASPGHEQRRSPRRKYQYYQLIAPIQGSAMPAAKNFFPVVCEDISAGGIAFYLDHPPQFRDLVVSLGTPPAITYFAAQVARFTEKSLDGKTVYLVGCRFTGRVQLSDVDFFRGPT